MGSEKRMSQVFGNEPLFSEWLKKNINDYQNIFSEGEEVISKINTEVNKSDENGKGKYRADILAEYDNGKKFIIENQYRFTDHIHLGEIITYAAWLNVREVFWIAEKVDKEHFNAVKWINENTKDFKIQVLLVKAKGDYPDDGIELSKPSDQDVAEKPKNEFLPQNADINREFWNKFEEVFEANGRGKLNRLKRTDCVTITWGEEFLINLPFRKYNFKVELQFKNNSDVYRDKMQNALDLMQMKDNMGLDSYDEIEIPDTKTFQIRVTCPAHVKNADKWDEYIDKMLRVIDYFQRLSDEYKYCY